MLRSHCILMSFRSGTIPADQIGPPALWTEPTIGSVPDQRYRLMLIKDLDAQFLPFLLSYLHGLFHYLIPQSYLLPTLYKCTDPLPLPTRPLALPHPPTRHTWSHPEHVNCYKLVGSMHALHDNILVMTALIPSSPMASQNISDTTRRS